MDRNHQAWPRHQPIHSSPHSDIHPPQFIHLFRRVIRRVRQSHQLPRPQLRRRLPTRFDQQAFPRKLNPHMSPKLDTTLLFRPHRPPPCLYKRILLLPNQHHLRSTQGLHNHLLVSRMNIFLPLLSCCMFHRRVGYRITSQDHDRCPPNHSKPPNASRVLHKCPRIKLTVMRPWLFRYRTDRTRCYRSLPRQDLRLLFSRIHSPFPQDLLDP
jgi:hypothetical protein